MSETPFVEPVICGKDDEDLLDHCDVHVVDPERVTAVRARLVSPGVAGQMATVFKVLADQSRCRLMAAIIEAGELCVCDLAATVEMTRATSAITCASCARTGWCVPAGPARWCSTRPTTRTSACCWTSRANTSSTGPRISRAEADGGRALLAAGAGGGRP